MTGSKCYYCFSVSRLCLFSYYSGVFTLFPSPSLKFLKLTPFCSSSMRIKASILSLALLLSGKHPIVSLNVSNYKLSHIYYRPASLCVSCMLYFAFDSTVMLDSLSNSTVFIWPSRACPLITSFVILNDFPNYIMLSTVEAPWVMVMTQRYFVLLDAVNCSPASHIGTISNSCGLCGIAQFPVLHAMLSWRSQSLDG